MPNDITRTPRVHVLMPNSVTRTSRVPWLNWRRPGVTLQPYFRKPDEEVQGSVRTARIHKKTDYPVPLSPELVLHQINDYTIQLLAESMTERIYSFDTNRIIGETCLGTSVHCKFSLFGKKRQTTKKKLNSLLCSMVFSLHRWRSIMILYKNHPTSPKQPHPPPPPI